MRFVALHRCAKCRGVLSRATVCYSSGVCPYCGHSSGSTIVDHVTESMREIELRPWWKFWAGPRFRYELRG